MKPGPVQRLWLDNLRKYPERQTTNRLGEGTPENYQACCLGELLLCYHKAKNLELPFIDDYIMDDESNAVLCCSFERLGLKDETGRFMEPQDQEINCSLSTLNDEEMSWPEIADFVENNFEKVFNKSV